MTDGRGTGAERRAGSERNRGIASLSARPRAGRGRDQAGRHHCTGRHRRIASPGHRFALAAGQPAAGPVVLSTAESRSAGVRRHGRSHNGRMRRFPISLLGVVSRSHRAVSGDLPVVSPSAGMARASRPCADTRKAEGPLWPTGGSVCGTRRPTQSRCRIFLCGELTKVEYAHGRLDFFGFVTGSKEQFTGSQRRHDQPRQLVPPLSDQRWKSYPNLAG